MKKGFTLVEVLAVIVITGLIFLIAFPTMLNSIKKSQDKIDDNTFELLKNASKEYSSDNIDNIEDNYCIDVNTLISGGYIDEDIITAKDNKLLNKAIKYNENTYEIVESCSNE